MTTKTKTKKSSKAAKNVASSEEMQVDKTIGQQLKNKRVEKDLKIEQVAQQLNLSSHAIEQIENDNYDDLPEMTYVRGYIVSYCRLLDLPSDNVISLLVSDANTGVVSSAAYAQNSRISSRQRSSFKKSSFGKFLIVGSLLGICALIYMQYNDMLVQGSSSSEAQVDEASEQAEAVTVLDTSVESGTATAIISEESEIAKPESSEVATTQETVDAAKKGLLEMEFNSISWVDVKNANQERIIYQSFPRGEKYKVVTNLPLDIFIDNAQGVVMHYEGKVVDLANKVKDDGYVKFTLAE